jgi:hypothetical protein
MISVQLVPFKMRLEITYCDSEMKSDTVPLAHVMSSPSCPHDTFECKPRCKAALRSSAGVSVVFNVSVFFLSSRR